MPINPELFKQDHRTPQQLAKAILDHEYTPRNTVTRYSLSFRELLFHDAQTQCETEYGSGLLYTLKAWEEGAPPDLQDKRALSRALQVIAAYKKDSAESRDHAAKQVAATPFDRHNNYHRGEAESMEESMVEISNLKSIEKLVRALAHQLGVSLIEPERCK